MKLITKDSKNIFWIELRFVKFCLIWIFYLERSSLMCYFTFHTFWDRYYFEAFQSFRKIWYSVLLETYILTHAFQNKRKMPLVSFSLSWFIMKKNITIKFNNGRWLMLLLIMFFSYPFGIHIPTVLFDLFREHSYMTLYWDSYFWDLDPGSLRKISFLCWFKGIQGF